MQGVFIGIKQDRNEYRSSWRPSFQAKKYFAVALNIVNYIQRVYLPTITSFRISPSRIIRDYLACESSQVRRCGISTSSSGLGGADQKRKQEMTNFTRVNLKAWANTKSPMWRRKWRIEHWSCSHSDDSIWVICCIHVACHMMACCRCMILIQSRHINSLTAKADSYIRKKSKTFSLADLHALPYIYMHVGSLNCMHNRAHRANDHSAKAALASPVMGRK